MWQIYLKNGIRGPLGGLYGRDPPGESLAVGISGTEQSYPFVHVYDDIITPSCHPSCIQLVNA